MTQLRSSLFLKVPSAEAALARQLQELEGKAKVTENLARLDLGSVFGGRSGRFLNSSGFRPLVKKEQEGS